MICWVRNIETNKKQTLRLDQKPYLLFDHDGFGIPKAARLEDSGPLQHGTSDRGMKLPARDVVLYVKLFADDWEDYYEKRAELARWFSPFGNAGVLRVTEDGVGGSNGGGGLEISGYAVEGLEYPGSDREGLNQIVPIVLHCANPFWQDINATTVTFSAGGGSDTFEVPTVVPFKVGASTMLVSQLVDYVGDADAYPIIKIFGPVTDLNISQVASKTTMKLDFAGTTIAAGDWYEIDLRYGVKTIKDSNGVNKISALSANSNLATFRLFAGASNYISMTGTGITSSTMAQLTWKNAYGGI